MKFLFDLFPVILFFVAYELAKLSPDAAHTLAQHLMGGFVSGGVVSADQAPILLATAAAIVATSASSLRPKVIVRSAWPRAARTSRSR